MPENRGCGGFGFGDDCCWIIILILILCCCCGVSLSLIHTSLSFDIEIENNKNEKFRTNVYFDMPYEYDDKSIYDGNLKVKKDVKFDFYRYE